VPGQKFKKTNPNFDFGGWFKVKSSGDIVALDEVLDLDEG
jgi:hypothetical protein